MTTIIDDVLARCKLNKETGCLEWQGPKLKAGYGAIWIGNRKDGRRKVLAHRLAWEQSHEKEIPKGMFVCHTCDNPPCCNPDHLFIGEPKDNINDMIRKGRRKQGEMSEEARSRVGKASSQRVSGEKNYFYKNPRPVEELRERAKQQQLGSRGYFWQASSERWRVSWTCGDGKRRSWLVKTEKEAIEKVALLKQELLETSR